MPQKTYKEVLDVIVHNVTQRYGKVYVAVHYPTGTYEWLPVDKFEYIRQLRGISNPESVMFPCYFEVESDGDMYIHSKMENTN